LRKLGFIVNPIAGMGGRVGLKGTDGWDIVEKAKALGALPGASERAAQALSRLAHLKGEVDLWTCSGNMGESVAAKCGFAPAIVEAVSREKTTPEDTSRAARKMAEGPVDLLLFAGGDGTAKDIQAAVGDRLAVLGIPAGVKMHSAVFAVNPLLAGELAEKDLNEEKLYNRIRGKRGRLVIAPIGGQGFLFGRGNQQVSPRIIREIRKDNVLVVCTQQKLHSLRGRPFRVDTGDPGLDRALNGPILVITGSRSRAVCRVQ
jgi:predicted polyphosphate/ATP-dependent NAD kinase